MEKEIMSLFGTNRLKWAAALRKTNRRNIIPHENKSYTNNYNELDAQIYTWEVHHQCHIR